MPIYEYEPVDRECLICEGRFEVLQRVGEPAYERCPYCGFEVRRVISRPGVRIAKSVTPDKAAKLGFSTFRRVQKGVWEKVAGPDNAPPPEPETEP